MYDKRVYRPTLPPSREEQIVFLNDIRNGVYDRLKEVLIQEYIDRNEGDFRIMLLIYAQCNNATFYQEVFQHQNVFYESFRTNYSVPNGTRGACYANRIGPNGGTIYSE